MIGVQAGAFIAVAAIVVGYFLRGALKTHREGMLAAKASGALWDLGLDVKRLPPEAKEKFFREANALSTATKGSFHSKRFAMRFFGWYGVEYLGVDASAFRWEGVLSESIKTMRRWSKAEPSLSEAAEKEVKLIFNYLYEAFEVSAMPKEQRLSGQLALLEIMRDTDSANSRSRSADTLL